MTPAEKRQHRAVSLSLFLGVAILSLKFAAYAMTNSAALLSDALESIINVVASAFAMWSLYLARQPADKNHPYGHGKVEYFSALLEGGLIALAAVAIIWQSFPKIFAPVQLNSLDAGLAVSVAASVVNLLLGLHLVRVGKQTSSLTLVADGRHVLTDVFTTGGVLAGLFVVAISGWLWLDGLIACLVAVNIVFTGVSLLRQAIKGLMNESNEEVLDRISQALKEHRGSSWVSIHRLRCWQAGRHFYVDFHLVLPRRMPLSEVGEVLRNAKRILCEHIDGSIELLIHPDSCEDDDCKRCSQAECPLRTENQSMDGLWSLAELTAADEHSETR